jgi:cytochrome c oxidase subunit II
VIAESGKLDAALCGFSRLLENRLSADLIERRLKRNCRMQILGWKNSNIKFALQILVTLASPVTATFALPPGEVSKSLNIFSPVSTPADSIFQLAMFVLAITGVIFVTVSFLLVYSAVKFRRRAGDDGREPPQVYGSNQLELAWTVIPVLIVVALFLTTARFIHAIQDARRPKGAIEVTAIGHQFWWEYRYPQYGFVTANELHVPVSDPKQPTPTFLTLLSADTDHSFWVPRLAGKTDLIPNHPNGMWIDPHETGVYLGQCAQYCGTQHAKMLLRVYVEPRADFDRWVQAQRQPVAANAPLDPSAAEGRRVFETTACINCHVVSGTVANGQFGPDLTHLMSRDTIASGAASNTPENLRLWIENPDAIKPGSLMPAMNLSREEFDRLNAYLLTLH